MKTLLWNVNRGPGARRIDWIANQEWDVAMLLEVSGRGWLDLSADDRWAASGTFEQPYTGSRRFMTAVLARNGAQLLDTPVSGPVFDVLDGRYQERAHAVRVAADDVEWTIAAVHMPNSVTRTGGKDHAPKDACYEQLAKWLKPIVERERLIIGIDTNRGDWPHSTSRPRPGGPFVQEFLRNLQHHGVRDVYLDDPAGTPARPETHWTRRGGDYRGHYYDRILVSRAVRVVSPPTFHTDLGHPANRQTRLSDHAAVTVTLGPI